jgi:DNA-binding transcriptional regulator YhcF (GntR family)
MDFKDTTPIYIQVAERICDCIQTGQYAENERIPSVREYAVFVEVNANTVVRSYDYLQQLGAIYNKRGLGYFVSEGASEIIQNRRRDNFYKEYLPDFFHRIRVLSISMDDINRRYSTYLEQKEHDRTE